jgi:thiamine-monophosphate kinase
MVDVTLTGSVRRRRVLTRSGASPGDELYVTGFPGAARAGLSALRAGAEGGRVDESDELAECIARYRRPEPRARIGLLAGRNRAASACMDLSDGLADAITQMAEASGVGAIVDAAAVPILPAARRWFERTGNDPVTATLSGGDDYELLLAVPRRARGRFATVRRQAQGIPLTRIGALTEERTIRLQRGDATEPLPAGFVHF